MGHAAGIANAIQQRPVRNARGDKKGVTGRYQVFQGQDARQINARLLCLLAIFGAAGPENALDSAAHSPQAARRQHRLGRSADAHQHVNPGARPGGHQRAGHIPRGDQANAGAALTHLVDQTLMPGAIQNDHRDLIQIHTLGVGHFCEVVLDRGINIDHILGLRADGNFGHVKHRARVKHGATRRCCHSGDRIGHALGYQLRPLHRVNGKIQFRWVTGADHLTIEQHRRVVFLSLTDHHSPCHFNLVQQEAHGVYRCGIGVLFGPAAKMAACSHGGCFSHTDQFQSYVTSWFLCSGVFHIIPSSYG